MAGPDDNDVIRYGRALVELTIAWEIDMTMRHVLEPWIIEAMTELGGCGSLVDVCTCIWTKHEAELRSSGELFYTWQYDVRWVGNQLRQRKILKPMEGCRRRMWEMEMLSLAARDEA